MGYKTVLYVTHTGSDWSTTESQPDMYLFYTRVTATALNDMNMAIGSYT